MKVCPQHLGSESWLDAPIHDLECMYTANQVEDMVDLLRTESRTSRRNAPGIKYKDCLDYRNYSIVTFWISISANERLEGYGQT